jgi:asparagine synthase (glutamine-hydrolysing)
VCGISGKVSVDGRHAAPSRELLAAMVAAIAHRGPDEQGIYRDRRAGLASARLAIVDIAAGQQPMSDASESQWVVFNGEIFNHVELRRELEAAGRVFRTRSDTEVILHAYAAWGLGCFERFNGQWAIALWNRTEHELVLARDPIGICPLYVRQHGGTVWFASEVKALFADPAVPREIDPAGIDQTFTYWAPLAPTTVFSGIDELLPGTCRVYRGSADGVDHTHWRPTFPEAGATAPWSLDEATQLLQERLAEATRLRMTRADVPVGVYLSGGLDSSVIARLARDSAAGEFRTFSVAFDDAEFDERSYQDQMSSMLGSRHHTVVVGRDAIAAAFPDVIRHTERPVLRTAPTPMFLLSRLVRDEGIKAVLTGEGADEMLAGYDIFREARIREFWARRPDSTLRPLLFDRIYPYLARSPALAKGMAHAFWKRGLDRMGQPGSSHEPRWWTTASIKRMFSAEFAASVAAAPPGDPLASLPAEFSSWSSLARAQYLEITTLLAPYLVSSQGDRMMMAHSVEGRFPFLDRNVVDFCNALPPGYKLANLDEKHILKRFATGLVPPAIARRKKQAYRAPDAAAFVTEGGLVDYAEDALSAPSIADTGVFNPTAVAGLVRKARRLGTDGAAAFGNTDNMALVGILSTQLLDRVFETNGHAGAALQMTSAVLRDIDRTDTAT